MGVKINKDSFANVVSSFVIWMDKTYPHLNGALTVQVDKGVPTFKYEPLDGIKLSPADKALIRAQWEKCMKQKCTCDKPCGDPEKLPDQAIQAIAKIEGGYYSEAIRCLLNLIDEIHFGEEEAETEEF